MIRPTNVQIKAATPNMRITRDVPIPMRDGSYLSANQYRTAALQPPHLKAICPWEGVSYLYKEFLYSGGIPEEG